MNALFNATQIKKHDAHFTRPFESAFPTAPFPRKYVHCVFDDEHDALQAVLTLLATNYDATTIHVLTGEEYMSTLEQRQTLLGFLTSMDMKEYMQEAGRGRSILVIRPENYEQLRQIRQLLVPHHARLMRYIDTWTTTELLA